MTPQGPSKAKPPNWLSSLHSVRARNTPILSSPKSSLNTHYSSAAISRNSQTLVGVVAHAPPRTVHCETPPPPGTRKNAPPKLRTGIPNSLDKTRAGQEKHKATSTNASPGHTSMEVLCNQPAVTLFAYNSSRVVQQVKKGQETGGHDIATLPRAVKVHDTVRSIIPAHKGIELSYDQRVLGSFGIDLREKIGEGVYAKVRLGVDLFSGKPEDSSKFAIKIIDKEKVTSRFLENFLNRELTIWSKLSHVGITQFYYYTVTPRKVYMVLEYLNGGDLLTYVQNLKVLPERQQVASWSWQLVNAIDYIHSLGAAHRDIKLENILMDSTASRLKLTDFGFSTGDTSRLSTTFCGSKAYAAPELIRAIPYSPQAVDIWALGCVFFVFINGIMAFDETVEQSVLLYNQRNRVYVWRNPRNHSPTAKKTVESMLTCDWKLRPTTTVLRNDPWIRNGSLRSCNNS